MSRKGWAALFGLAVAIAMVWAFARPPKTEPILRNAATANQKADAREAALQATPQARAYRERKVFERETRDFLRSSAQMGSVTRSERARALVGSIDAYEQAKEMSAGEALMLRVALIRASSVDDAEAAERIAEVTERYRAIAARREATWEAEQRNDPRFQDYKARERAVVAEVMAMSEIPGGLSRDEYLRQRLEQERIRAYR
ncbi:MAG TPA: hypothetical protein VJ806_08005 [Luteimonas sp.]|nr:hypothetical protein [Luteimonas sp.]